MITLKEHLIKQKINEKTIIGRYKVYRAGWWDNKKTIYTIYAYELHDTKKDKYLIKYVYNKNDKKLQHQFYYCKNSNPNVFFGIFIIPLHKVVPDENEELTKEEADEFMKYVETHKNDILKFDKLF